MGARSCRTLANNFSESISDGAKCSEKKTRAPAQEENLIRPAHHAPDRNYSRVNIITPDATVQAAAKCRYNTGLVLTYDQQNLWG
jgi:hypothetical protein